MLPQKGVLHNPETEIFLGQLNSIVLKSVHNSHLSWAQQSLPNFVSYSFSFKVLTPGELGTTDARGVCWGRI